MCVYVAGGGGGGGGGGGAWGATVQVKELNLLARRDENKWSQTS